MKSVYDEKNKCCGCAACKQICPKSCIKMVEDECGYIYPAVNVNECINCGLCKKVCIFNNSKNGHIPVSCYAYLNENEDYRLKSASSGLFETICRAYFKNENDIAIFGCEIDNDLKVHHRSLYSIDDIVMFKKSKYVQSRIDTEFIEVKKCLESGKKVVFCGTPCQVDALKNFLGKDYDSLLLIDFVCHGVPNQKIFDRYISYLEKQYHSKVIKYTFRHKKKINGKWSNLGVKIQFENGKSVESDAIEDLYMTGFLAGLFNRESCYECRYANTNRVSDITIGDFWGIGNIIPDLDETKTNGTSLLLVNTSKGSKVVDSIDKESLFRTKLEDAVKENGQLKYPQKLPKVRAAFLEAFKKNKSFKGCMKKAYPDKYKRFRKEDIYKLKIYIMMSNMKKRLLKR